MKKVMCALMSAVLLICGSLPALGEISVSLAGLIRFMRPEALEPMEVSEEEFAEGLVYSAAGSEAEMYITVIQPADMTFDGLLSSCRADGAVSDLSDSQTGGLRCVRYRKNGSLYAQFILAGPDARVEFRFVSLSAEGEKQIAGLLESVQSL
ncbi:MAG: hypothetical protein IKE30_00145 [Clostridia bacterium]|nr:hypothetical protein [Clostridia bacterium]